MVTLNLLKGFILLVIIMGIGVIMTVEITQTQEAFILSNIVALQGASGGFHLHQ